MATPDPIPGTACVISNGLRVVFKLSGVTIIPCLFVLVRVGLTRERGHWPGACHGGSEHDCRTAGSGRRSASAPQGRAHPRRGPAPPVAAGGRLAKLRRTLLQPDPRRNPCRRQRRVATGGCGRERNGHHRWPSPPPSSSPSFRIRGFLGLGESSPAWGH